MVWLVRKEKAYIKTPSKRNYLVICHLEPAPRPTPSPIYQRFLILAETPNHESLIHLKAKTYYRNHSFKGHVAKLPTKTL